MSIMKTTSKIVAAAGALVFLGGCVSMPSGPGVMVLPGTDKSFDQFRADDMECRQFASSQVGGSTAEQAQVDSAVKSAAVGAAVGAAAGAIIGGHRSAGAGAGTGLIIGSVAGAGTGNSSGHTLQQRYDIGYTQCMYAKGHKIPSASRYENTRRPVSSNTTPPPPPPTAGAVPPSPTAGAYPPPGTPPPPGAK
jgi:outer membrane lipoprotein SlyB